MVNRFIHARGAPYLLEPLLLADATAAMSLSPMPRTETLFDDATDGHVCNVLITALFVYCRLFAPSNICHHSIFFLSSSYSYSLVLLTAPLFPSFLLVGRKTWLFLSFLPFSPPPQIEVYFFVSAKCIFFLYHLVEHSGAHLFPTIITITTT